MEQRDTIELVKKAQKRDHDAFTQLIRLNTRDMYRTAVSILKNDEDAADAIQDAILACWEKLPTLKTAAYFKTWLTRILINKCYDIRKRNSRYTYTDEFVEEAGEEHYSIELKEAFSKLSEKYRRILFLYYGEGYQTGEIAKMLHIPKSTVQTRLKRGREKMADYYKD